MILTAAESRIFDRFDRVALLNERLKRLLLMGIGCTDIRAIVSLASDAPVRPLARRSYHVVRLIPSASQGFDAVREAAKKSARVRL